MPRYKPVIKIDKEDKVGYRILNGLSREREYIVDNIDSHKKGLLSHIGRNTKVLKPDYPIIWHNSDRSNGKRLLKLPPSIEIEETQGTNQVFFKFKRRTIL